MQRPNDFQLSSEKKVRALAAAKGLSCEQEIYPDVFEQDQPAIKISSGDYIFWIYPDGAGVGGPQLDKRFEIESYDSIQSLQSDYLSFVEVILR